MRDLIPERPFITTERHLSTFGKQCELVDKKELVRISRDLVGCGVDVSFTRFVDWLKSEEYTFHCFDEGRVRFDEPCAYLRYDVHPQDLLAAYVLADLHEQLEIVGSFQITWQFSANHEAVTPYFTKLLEFDRRFVQFGLHVAPMATWYLNEKLGGSVRASNRINGDGFAGWVLELLAAYTRDGDDAPALREIREGADNTLMRIASSFRATFGDCRSLSGHGNFLLGEFFKVRAKYPEVDVLRPYFSHTEYFIKWGVERFGFDYELSWFGSDKVPYPRVIWEGPPPDVRRKNYYGRVKERAGFVAVLHPANWTCQHNATFFLPASG